VTLPALLAAAFTLGWLPLFVFRSETVSEAFPAYGSGERFWVLATPALIAAHVALSCHLVGSRAQIPAGRAALSLLLFAAGVGFWLWARRTIGPLRVRRHPDQPPARLRRDGPFGLVRNPLYLGTLTAAAAPALATGRLLPLSTFAACVGALVVRSVQEERRLHEQLGEEYAEYSRAVKRLVPFVW
jgi:protein-S-isoprenylcysteine O-methyltransferase Ste14